MAIFQFAERGTPRQRAADLGIRIVWRADFEDVSGTHLHPVRHRRRDRVARLGRSSRIVALGGAGAGGVARPRELRGGITSLTVAASDPGKVSARWAEVLGPGARLADTTVHLDEAGQELSFVPAVDARHEGITGCGLALPTATARGTTDIGGVQFTRPRRVGIHEWLTPARISTGSRTSSRRAQGCEDCLRIGGRWVHLRCACPAVTSVAVTTRPTATRPRIGTQHADHPLIRSYEPGEDWWWCYADELFFEVEGRAAGALASVTRCIGHGHSTVRHHPRRLGASRRRGVPVRRSHGDGGAGRLAGRLRHRDAG